MALGGARLFVIAFLVSIVPVHSSDDDIYSRTQYMSGISDKSGVRHRHRAVRLDDDFFAAARTPLLPLVKTADAASASNHPTPPLKKAGASQIQDNFLTVKRLDKFQLEQLFKKANQGDFEARKQLMQRYLNNLNSCWMARYIGDASIWGPKRVMNQDGSYDYLSVRFMVNLWNQEECNSLANLFAFIEQAAERGDAEAQLACADILRKGYGVKKDLSQALSWYSKATGQGHGWGAFGAAQVYRELGDEVEAVAQYQIAADAGLACAQRELAQCYGLAKGVNKDIKLYHYNLERAADQGDPFSEACMAVSYERGFHIPVNAQKAAIYMTRAAEQDLPEAAFRLGRYYKQGLGFNKNPDIAMYWIKHAAKLDFAEACLDLAEHHYYNNQLSKWQNYVLAARYAIQSALPAADSYIKNVLTYVAENYKPTENQFSINVEPESNLAKLSAKIDELNRLIYPLGVNKSSIPPLLHSIFEFIKTYCADLHALWAKSITLPMMVDCFVFDPFYGYWYVAAAEDAEVKEFMHFISLFRKGPEGEKTKPVMSIGFENAREAEKAKILFDPTIPTWTNESVALIKKSILPYTERLCLEEQGLDNLIEESHKESEFYTPLNTRGPALKRGGVLSYLTLLNEAYTKAIELLNGKIEGFKRAMKFFEDEAGLAKASQLLKAYERTMEMLIAMRSLFNELQDVIVPAIDSVVQRLIATTPVRNSLFLKDPKNAGILRALGITIASAGK